MDSLEETEKNKTRNDRHRCLRHSTKDDSLDRGIGCALIQHFNVLLQFVVIIIVYFLYLF